LAVRQSLQNAGGMLNSRRGPIALV
jgi:hypothetical protein